MKRGLCWTIVLQRRLESADVGVAGDVRCDVNGAEVLRGEEVVYIAAEAARIIAVSVSARVGLYFESWVHCWG